MSTHWKLHSLLDGQQKLEVPAHLSEFSSSQPDLELSHWVRFSKWKHKINVFSTEGSRKYILGPAERD